jgi:membrane carboxypeptidase/penicillin-binding protein PbpC
MQVSFSIVMKTGAELVVGWKDDYGVVVSAEKTEITTEETLTITAAGEITVVRWLVDGEVKATSGSTFVFSSTATGKHTVVLLVSKDGKVYSTNIPITVALPQQ